MAEKDKKTIPTKGKKTKECPYCHGDGEAIKFIKGVDTVVDCSSCNGTGEVEDK